MKKFLVTYTDVFENCEDVEDAYSKLLSYLEQCASYEDLSAFNIELFEES